MADLWAQIYPNLLASLIWAVPGGLAHLHTRRHIKRLHAKLDQGKDDPA